MKVPCRTICVYIMRLQQPVASGLPCLWGPFAPSDIRTRLRNQLMRQYWQDVHLAVEKGVTASINQP